MAEGDIHHRKLSYEIVGCASACIPPSDPAGTRKQFTNAPFASRAGKGQNTFCLRETRRSSLRRGTLSGSSAWIIVVGEAVMYRTESLGRHQ